MKLADIKVGNYYFAWGDIRAKVVAIRETKHYGPDMNVRCRFDDGHMEYFAADEITVEPQLAGLSKGTQKKLLVQYEENKKRNKQDWTITRRSDGHGGRRRF